MPETSILTSPDLHLNVLRDVYVDVYHGFAITRAGRIIEDTAVVSSTISQKVQDGTYFRRTAVMSTDRPVVCLDAGPKHANFFHFWLDSLTKLIWLDEPEITALGPLDLAHCRPLAEWQAVMLQAALPPGTRVLRVPRSARLHASVYIDLPPAYRGMFLEPRVVDLLRRWAEPLTAGVARPPERRRVYVSRRHARRRRLLNDDVLQEQLVAAGFTAVVLEELPVGEQIVLFQEAEMIVAQHGAGLTHLLHARPGTPVLEIQSGPPGPAPEHYRGISAAVGLRYSNVFCHGPDPGADVRAPVSEVLAWIERVGAETSRP